MVACGGSDIMIRKLLSIIASSRRSTSILLAYWSFDGDSTDSVGGANGTDTAITYSAGQINDAAFFVEASDSDIDTPFAIDWKNRDWTITIWSNMTGDNSIKGIVSNRSTGIVSGGWVTLGVHDDLLYLETDGGITFSATDNFNPSGQGWQFYTITYDSGSGLLSLFRNTVACGTDSTGEPGGIGNKIGFGRWFIDGQNWEGGIDQCKIWNKVLTSGEMTDEYNLGI
jgi:hypothetical protein